jgi:peptide/nickel transport system substrate-binding protein
MASRVGLEVLTQPRDIGAATGGLVGYRGEPVVLLSSSDRPVYSQVPFVARDLSQKLDLSAAFQTKDWGAVITGHSLTDKGGWSAFMTALGGLTVSNPSGNFAFRGSGQNSLVRPARG